MILAFTALLNSILSYFNIDLYILSYIGGISIFTMIFLYLSSYVFKFCEYHRMFLHYVVVTWIINNWFNDDDWAYKDKVQKLFK